ncbi:MAG: DUF4116 domain-containing protein, partial [Candidatus Omnitrophica bacterium]|nr:DUF4116 domain-containing protein [Candidatus Omnitrophota bacterium]
MTTSIVKKNQMKRAEWTAFVDVLRRVDARKASAIIKDDKVTDAEINKLLDRNADGKVRYQDFSSLTNPLFKQIKGVLKKHRFSAYRLWKPSTGNLPGVPGQFWADKDFVFAAMKQDPGLLKYAVKGIVLAVVKKDGRMLQYASAVFKKDKEVVLAAVGSPFYEALAYADATLRNDRKFILAAVKRNGKSLQYASAVFKKDKEVVLAA